MLPSGSREADTTVPADARARMVRLQVEWIDALEAGAPEDCSYMEYLAGAIDRARADFIAASVIELAALRADLDGPLLG